VYTGSKAMAGTNANVFVTFYGRKGTSARLQLKNDKGKGRAFQKGSKDSFRLAMKNLGPLTGLRFSFRIFILVSSFSSSLFSSSSSSSSSSSRQEN